MPGSAPARIFSANVVHAVRGKITFGSPTAGVEIGTIPAGSFVRAVTVDVITAFNAGTTNVLEVGTAADPDGFATSTDIAAGATGLKGPLKGAQSGDRLTADTPVVVKYSPTGTAATAGEAQVLVEFYPHKT